MSQLNRGLTLLRKTDSFEAMCGQEAAEAVEEISEITTITRGGSCSSIDARETPWKEEILHEERERWAEQDISISKTLTRSREMAAKLSSKNVRSSSLRSFLANVIKKCDDSTAVKETANIRAGPEAGGKAEVNEQAENAIARARLTDVAALEVLSGGWDEAYGGTNTKFDENTRERATMLDDHSDQNYRTSIVMKGLLKSQSPERTSASKEPVVSDLLERRILRESTEAKFRNTGGPRWRDLPYGSAAGLLAAKREEEGRAAAHER